MNPLVIAVDTGNKNIKTPHTEPFNSGLICHGAIPPAVKSDTLLFDGNYYTLTQSRIPYMYNKTTDWSYYVLTLIAIAKEMMAMGYVRPGQKQVKQDVCLAMGLPPTHIHDLASEYDKYFGRDGRRVVFTYNNVDFEVRIVRVMVFPQGVAAIAPYMSKIMARPEAYTYIIDIGGYTTDVLLLKNGKLDFQFCRSLESGVITMNNEIIRKVNSYHDMLLDDEHISDVLCGRNIGLPADVVETITSATKQPASNILNQLRELQVDLRSNPAIFVGGGSILLRPFLEDSPMVMRGSFVDSPNANAVGYEMLGRTQMLRPNA